MNFCLTNAGKEYIARINAGEQQMHLTKAITGAGSSSNLQILTAVVDEQQQIQIDEVTSDGEYTYIACVLTNIELEQEYILHQIGLYGMDVDGGEKLIIIGQDSYGDRIPVISEKEVELQYNIGMRVSNVSEIIFDFSVNDFLRKKYFYEYLEEYEKYKNGIQKQFTDLPIVKIGIKEELNRKDTILFELLKDTNKVLRILQADNNDVRKEFELAAVFSTAIQREQLQSQDTLGTLFGKIKKYFVDLKDNCFKEADDPFVLMTESTYKSPEKRTDGSLYGLITKTRGLVIVYYDRYVQGLEEPLKSQTLYGIETLTRAEVTVAANPYVGVLSNIVFFNDTDTTLPEREVGKIYAVVKISKGG